MAYATIASIARSPALVHLSRGKPGSSHLAFGAAGATAFLATFAAPALLISAWDGAAAPVAAFAAATACASIHLPCISASCSSLFPLIARVASSCFARPTGSVNPKICWSSVALVRRSAAGRARIQAAIWPLP